MTPNALRANSAFRSAVHKAPEPKRPATARQAAKQPSWPLDHTNGDSYADEILRRERARQRKAFIAPSAQAKWMVLVINQEIAALYRQKNAIVGSGGKWADEFIEDLDVKLIELKVRRDSLYQRYSGEWRS